jgi:hypothetical protein
MLLTSEFKLKCIHKFNYSCLNHKIQNNLPVFNTMLHLNNGDVMQERECNWAKI